MIRLRTMLRNVGFPSSTQPTNCDVSRFIKEMKLDEGTAIPTEDEVMSPQDRLANLKALLAKPKVA